MALQQLHALAFVAEDPAVLCVREGEEAATNSEGSEGAVCPTLLGPAASETAVRGWGDRVGVISDLFEDGSNNTQRSQATVAIN